MFSFSIRARGAKFVHEIRKFQTRHFNDSDESLRDTFQAFKPRLNNNPSDAEIYAALGVALVALERHVPFKLRDAQVLAAYHLYHGKAIDLPTGEGKTYAAFPALATRALIGQSALVTANSYLASRDLARLQKAYTLLGLSAGLAIPETPSVVLKEVHGCDILYTTAPALIQTHLGDGLVPHEKQLVRHRPLHFALIDEVDAVLLDEAVLPVTLSAPTPPAPEILKVARSLADSLDEGIHYETVPDLKEITFTEAGIDSVEELLTAENLLEEGESLYGSGRPELLTAVLAAFRTKAFYKKGRHYRVDDGKIVLIDEASGRALPGRVLGEGLHQAIAAREGVEPPPLNRTLATMTYFDFFTEVPVLSGMSGTAWDCRDTLERMYGLSTVKVEPTIPSGRKDLPDLIFRTENEKIEALTEDALVAARKGRPVLIGTDALEAAQRIATLLAKQHDDVAVLTAENHQDEAALIARAGEPGRITVVANLAGRGTDILPGGNPEYLRWAGLSELAECVDEARAAVFKKGGILVLGAQRFPSRRADNQLRGRVGRRGAPGTSRFYVSLEDTLINEHGADAIRSIMAGLKMEKGEALTHPAAARIVDTAQSNREALDESRRVMVAKYGHVLHDTLSPIRRLRRSLLTAPLATVREFLAGKCAEGLGVLARQAIQWTETSLEDRCEITADEIETTFPLLFRFASLSLESVTHPAALDEACRTLIRESREELEMALARQGEKRLGEARTGLVLMLDSLVSDVIQLYEEQAPLIHLEAYGGGRPAEALQSRLLALTHSKVEEIYPLQCLAFAINSMEIANQKTLHTV